MSSAPASLARAGKVGALGSLLVLSLLGRADEARAYPRYFLEAGSPCATCHVSPQGGGVRNDIGWYQETHAALIPIGEKLPSSQAFAGGTLWGGGDFRFQMAKFGRPIEGNTEVDRKMIAMQMSIYAVAKPVNGVYISAALHLADIGAEQKWGTGVAAYPGQAPAEGSIQWSPKPSLPTFRAGLIQPSIGIRHEDHTMFIRANAANPRQPYIPPTYVEPGFEMSYHPISWFQMEAGVFNNRYLKQSVEGVSGDVSWLGRVMFMPELGKLHSWVGASAYGSGAFLMMNGFVGIGFPKNVSLMYDVAQTSYGTDRSTWAMTGTLSWSPKPWLNLYTRAEYSSAVVGSTFRTSNDNYVVGFTFNPLPFLEIRPEYRYLRTAEYVLGQYALQIAAYF